jgi:hypothetical protein
MNDDEFLILVVAVRNLYSRVTKLHDSPINCRFLFLMSFFFEDNFIERYTSRRSLVTAVLLVVFVGGLKPDTPRIIVWTATKTLCLLCISF